MVDWRSSGGRTPPARSSSSRSSSGGASRYNKRKKAFAKAGTGQFTPGALSAASASRTETVAPQSSPNNPYVTREGVSGQLVQQPTAQEIDVSSQSPAFAAKLVQMQNAQASKPGAEIDLGLGENTNNPFGANFSGEAPDRFAGIQEGVDNAKVSQPTAQKDQGLLGDIGLGGVQEAISNRVKQDLAAVGFGETVEGQQIFASAGLGGGWMGKLVGNAGLKGIANVLKPGVVKSLSKPSIGTKGLGLIKKLFTKQVSQMKTIVTNNPVTGQVTVKTMPELVTRRRNLAAIAIAVGGTIGFGLWAAEKVVDKTYEGKNFGNFLGNEEAAQAAGICVTMASYAEDYDGYLACRELQNEAANFDAGLIPIKNVADGIENNARVVKSAGDVMDKIMADKEAARLAGTDDNSAAAWAARDVEKAKMEAANVKSYNEQRLITENKVLESRSIANASERMANAAFWLEYKKKLFELEKLEREKIAAFWLAYAQMKFDLEEELQAKSRWNEGRSQLGFGLVG